jgi:hypothetical protein
MATTTTAGTGTTTGRRPDWKEIVGRVGLTGRGVLYMVLGLLAAQIAMGDQDRDASWKGVVQWVGSRPLGQFLLVALTLSLFALAGWRGLCAWFGDPVEGDEVTDRVKYAAKAVFYLALAVVSLVTTVAYWGGGGASSSGSAGGSGSSTEQQATSTLLDVSGGRWLVVAGGLAAIGYAVHAVWRDTVGTEFLDRVDADAPAWVEPLGRVGYAAKAVTYALVGWFLLQAGITHEAGRSKGLSESLHELSGGGLGLALLWVVAVGLVAFGLFTLAEAVYRRSA